VTKGVWKLLTIKDDTDHKREGVDVEIGEFLYNILDDIGEKENKISDHENIHKELLDEYEKWKNKINNNILN